MYNSSNCKKQLNLINGRNRSGEGKLMTTIEMNGEKKKHPFGKIMLRLLIILIFLCAIGAAAYFAYTLYRDSYGTFSSYEVLEEIERSDGTSAQYMEYKGLLLKYSRDGATAMDESGKFLWNGSYEMKDPIVDTCGDYVAVADRGSKLVHIFNASGAVNNITVDYPILQVQVANQGVVAVMMEEDNHIYIYLYKSNGDIIWYADKPISLYGSPLSMALSNNGQKMVVASLDFTTGTVQTNTAWYNFGEVGMNETNNLVGGLSFEGIVAKVDFITNNIVAIYKDGGFLLYNMEQKLDETPIVETEFETTIQSIFSSSSYVGFVLDTAEDEYKYSVVVYDTAGNKVLEKGINFDYSGISMNGSDIVFYNYGECMILNVKGKIRFQCQFEQSIDAIFGASTNKYYLVTNSSIEVIRLKGAK